MLGDPALIFVFVVMGSETFVYAHKQRLHTIIIVISITNLIKQADILKTSHTINRGGGLSYSFKDFNYEEACLITRAADAGFGVIYHHYFVC
jgi:hypothetical protein